MPRFEEREAGRFWEIEVDDATVSTATGRLDGSGQTRRSTRTHPDPDEAYYAAGLDIRAHRRRGYVAAGASQLLAGAEPAATGGGSTVLLDEFFERGDDRFHAEVRRSTAAGKLGALAERWYRDPRPWARAALLRYVDDGCDRPHHKPLVKKLFKLAEAAADDEAMAAFQVAFDRLTRRFLIVHDEYDWQTRTPLKRRALHDDPAVPAQLIRSGREPLESPVFSRTTRRYLARRAARYFRYLGYRDLARYRTAMTAALVRYTERSLSSTTRLLDAWGLVQALYAGSPVLERRRRGVRLAEDRSLAALLPAPRFPAAWRGADGWAAVWTLLADAGSRAVRSWAVTWARAEHADALAALPFARVATLLRSPHAEVAALGIERLPRTAGLETVPLVTWLELLAADDLDVVAVVSAVVDKVVDPARTTLAQCLDLATAPVAPAAELGLRWARTKTIDSALQLHQLARLARAGVPTVRAAGTAWALELARAHPQVDATYVRDLCDAPFADVRAVALPVVAADARFADDAALWFALTESPYDDVRAFVLAHVRRWQEAAPPETLARVWSTAVLAVHRGSKVKARVPRQIAERVAAHPDEADRLLPMLRLALGSVRAPERAAALAALARAVRLDPALAERTRALVPGLTIATEVAR
ncbi:MAG TPA: hypothetical protein VHE35_13580 [Kofleriaceae bacterium]|nr:hypothetical protein [Kofleriaceae bacterium]